MINFSNKSFSILKLLVASVMAAKSTTYDILKFLVIFSQKKCKKRDFLDKKPEKIKKIEKIKNLLPTFFGGYFFPPFDQISSLQVKNLRRQIFSDFLFSIFDFSAHFSHIKAQNLPVRPNFERTVLGTGWIFFDSVKSS